MAFSPETYGAVQSLIEESMVGAGAIKGQDGAPGKSAYEIAKDNGFEGSEEEWLESLIGTDGVSGKSAYEIAKDNGFEGTEEEWAESITVEQILTLDEYEALSDEEKNNGVTYYVDDGDTDGSGESINVDLSSIEQDISDLRTAIDELNDVWIRQEDYDALSDEEKDSDVSYYIYDTDTNDNAYTIPFASDKYSSTNVGDSLNEIKSRMTFRNIPVTINSTYVDTVNATPLVFARQAGPVVIVDLYDVTLKSIVNDGSTTIIASGLPKASIFHATHIVNRPLSTDPVKTVRVGIAQSSDKLVCWWSTASSTPVGAFTGQLMYFTSEW